MMVVMTLNRLVFERAVDEAVSRLKTSTEEIERAAGRVQVRAGTALAQEVKEYTASLEQKTTVAIDSIVETTGNATPFLNARSLGIVLLFVPLAFLIGHARAPTEAPLECRRQGTIC